VNSSGLARKVGIERACDDPGVVWLLTMQLEEVPAIQRQNRAFFHARLFQDLGIGRSTARKAPDDRGHVMAIRSQCLYHRQRHVLVRQQPRHDSSRLVLRDLALDLVAVTPHVGPGIGEILRAQ